MATNPPSTANDGTVAPPIVLPVAREEVHVSVRKVDTGCGVRVHKTVSEHAQAIEQSLLREVVSVKRVPIDKIVSLSEAPVAHQDGDTWIVPILEEVLVVEKRLRIKEEVHITRSAHAEAFSDTVVLRTEHVAIERFDEGAKPEVNTTNGGSHHATHSHRRL